jgi:intracellular multiplication protein IcmE
MTMKRIVRALGTVAAGLASASAALPALAQTAPPAPAQPQAVAPPSPEAVAAARINAQIDALLAPPSGGFAMTYYAKPAPVPGLAPQNAALTVQRPAGRNSRGQAENYVIAKPGDVTYATIDRAFNSDDPQAPIFATIHDIDGLGQRGPLDGVRLIGAITYSNKQGAIQFNQAYLADGRPLALRGMAISEDTARTGIAKDVDTHDFERYGSLLLATLTQGAGQVGQMLVQNNQQLSTNPATGAISLSQNIQPYQLGLAAALPLGQALTAAAAQGFNRPPTISGPAGMGIGVVFLDPVAVPRDVIFGH